jgi:hypothetical protein
MTTIPASQIVSANPGVLNAGGNALAINGVIMTQNTLLATNAVQSFDSPDSVSAFFGPSSAEYAASNIYFAGFDTSTVKPSTLYFASYVNGNTSAWLQSGSLSGMTLTQLNALEGVLTLTVDGTSFTSSTINLATASSFTDAANKISDGFSGTGKPTCSWNAVNSTFVLTSSTTGTGSTITYATGTLSAALMFTSATGASLSQGSAGNTPATAMANVIAETQDWALFTTMWEPVLADKENFAVWANAQDSRYRYVCWDTDAQAAVNGSTECFGYVAKTAEYDGVECVYNTLALAAFVLGMNASIDFSRLNGRITESFKTQSGFTPTVTDAQTASNLLANGYSFYGSYATANEKFNFFYNGQLTGKWLWGDSFTNQVYLNSQFQLALVELLTNVPSIPYNNQGYSLIRAAMQDPINQSLNFGSIRKGVTLSSAQSAEINNAAGQDVTQIIQNTGYYLQILDPTPQVREARGTPPINFWYTDGQAVQKISLASIDVL